MENTRMSAVKFGQKSSMIAVFQVWNLSKFSIRNILLQYLSSVPHRQTSDCFKFGQLEACGPGQPS